MQTTRISDRLSVSAQPSLHEFQCFHDQGFALVVNARPDEEEPGQAGNAAERDGAEQAGLSYSFIPVTGATITEADIFAFQSALAVAKGPGLAHCKTGTRALLLHALGEALDGRMKPNDISAYGQSFGFDLSSAVKWLERYYAHRPQVKGFFDPRTASIQYVVSDPDTGNAPSSIRVSTSMRSRARRRPGMPTRSSPMSRRRADGRMDSRHPSSCGPFLGSALSEGKDRAPTAIGERVVDVQSLWKGIYNWPEADDRWLAMGPASSPRATHSRSAPSMPVCCSRPATRLPR